MKGKSWYLENTQEANRRGQGHKEQVKKGIFTYAERRWVVPSSDSSRHTSDVRVPLREASMHTCTKTKVQGKKEQAMN